MRISSISPAKSAELECDGYVPLVVRFGGYSGPSTWAPKYWRTGDFQHSLIEVAVDPASGEICKVVVTLLRRIEDEVTVSRELSCTNGMPRADLSLWNDEHARVDVEQHISGSLVDHELTLIFGEVQKDSIEKIACDRVNFLRDHLGNLCGIQVRDLSEHELDNLRYATGGITD